MDEESPNGLKDGYETIVDDRCWQTVQNPQDQQDIVYLTGYKTGKIQSFIMTILRYVLLGVPYLWEKWYPRIAVLKWEKSPLEQAQFILLKDSYNSYFIRKVKTVEVPGAVAILKSKPVQEVAEMDKIFRFFYHNHVKYVWSWESKSFEIQHGLDSGIKTVGELLDESHGFTPEEQEILFQYYGRNEIKIDEKSYWKLFLSEVSNPFYIFQLFSIILWSCDDYYVYAICVFVITVGSIWTILRTAKHQRKCLKALVDASRVDNVRLIRRGGIVDEVSSSCLVPGDVIEIPRRGCVMPCDALLLQGNCIVNESTLTGESSTVTKIPPQRSPEKFDSFVFKQNTLYCGTRILQTRYYGDYKVTAVVINTGYCTAKGELIRSILHPKPLGFKFYDDSLRFVAGLFVIAALGIIYLLTIYMLREVDINTVILNCLDLITIVVPPALPAAMTSGIVSAQRRLKSLGIFCTSPARINIAGKLKLLCFDKTGTLTEEGLDLHSVMTVNRHGLLEEKYLEYLLCQDPFIVAMATCHSLTYVRGKLSGDPLDIAIFKAIHWELEELGEDSTRYDMLCSTIVKPKTRDHIGVAEQMEFGESRIRTCSFPASLAPTEKRPRSGSLQNNLYTFEAELFDESEILDEFPYEIGIVREFPFSSSNQCMSVITRRLGDDHMVLYCKGAPEKIVQLCQSQTIPFNLNRELKQLTSAGYRVLALAYRPFDKKFTWRKSQRVVRTAIECDLKFLGLVVLRNVLKRETTEVINQLRTASIRSVMITGDNMLTAVSVSRECGMVLPDDLVIQVLFKDSVAYQAIGVTDKISPGHCDLHDKNYHYALDGQTFALLRIHQPELLPNIIVRGTVFARMLPEQKTQLIEDFQDLNYIVGMCGDGANDVGAMKAAHVGISLSEAEHSVAAPFTCSNSNLSGIVYLLKEGRCALVTTFLIFKYMFMYSLIQFMAVLVLYTKGVSLGTMEFLYIDLIMTTALAVVMGRTGPAPILHENRPLARLNAASNLVPLLLEILLCLITQTTALILLHQQPWFVPVVPSNEEVVTSWENTVVYCVSSFQYLILAVVYSKGKPHCQPFYKDCKSVTNILVDKKLVWFMLVISSLGMFTTFLTVRPVWPLSSWFELVPIETDSGSQTSFRFVLLAFPLANLLLSVLIESSGDQKRWLKKLIHFLWKKKAPKNRYKQVLSQTIVICLFTVIDMTSQQNEILEVSEEDPVQDSNRNRKLSVKLSDIDPISRALVVVRSTFYDWFIRQKTLVAIGVPILLNAIALGYFAGALYVHLSKEDTHINWCDGIGLLIIIYAILYGFLFYYKIIKGVFGKTISKKLEPLRKTGKSLLSIRWARIVLKTVVYIGPLSALIIFLWLDTKGDAKRLTSLLGVVVFMLFGFIFSKYPGHIKWHTVYSGLALQYIFALLTVRWETGRNILECVGDKVTIFLDYTKNGTDFVYGSLLTNPDNGNVFAFSTLSVIFFFSFFVNLMSYYGVLQWIIVKISWLIQIAMGTTVCESVNAAASIFLGMTESPLLFRQYIPDLTKSELHAVLCGGWATIAGTVLAAYISFGVSPAHLIAATVMSAPASLCYAKLFYPEVEVSRNTLSNIVLVKEQANNALDAACKGAIAATELVFGIIANIIAFLAFVSFLDGLIHWIGVQISLDELSFQYILSKVFIPVSYLMGVDDESLEDVAVLVGTKTVINEFNAYQKMGELIKQHKLSKRTEAITTYALCGFSNFSSIGIFIGGLSALAPNQRPNMTAVALRAFIAANIVCFLTAAIAGTLISDDFVV